MRVRTVCMALALCLTLFGCGGGGDDDSGGGTPGGGFGTGGTTPPDPNTGNGTSDNDAGSATQEADSAENADAGEGPESTGDALVTSSTRVEYVGIDGAPSAEGLFCGGDSVKVLVRAVDIANRLLRLAIVKAPDTYVLPLEAQEEGDDIWSFTLDTGPLTIPDEGKPSTEGLDPQDPDDAATLAAINMMILEASKSVTLQVVAFEVNEAGEEVMPTDDNLMDEVKLTYDNTDPDLSADEPSADFDLQTISGFVDMAGTLFDQGGVDRVEVSFGGTLLATFYPGEDSNGKQLVYEGVADARREKSAFGDLLVTGYDTCGHSTTVSVPTKLIAWPWLRTYPTFSIPETPSINDSQVYDWNQDGFPDIIFATSKGIWFAQNDGVNTLEGLQVSFSSVTQLLDVSSDALALVDLDNDGTMDMVSVSRIGTQGLGLLVLRRSASPGVPISSAESHILPIGAQTKISGLVVDDFDLDGRQDAIVVTSAQEESLLVYKRIGDGELESDWCTEVEVEDESEDAEEGAMVTVLDCPTLFAPEPAISGGVDKITQVTVRDITGGANDGPDGYPDLVVGADEYNQVLVFPNRFEQSGLLDTAFSTAEGSFVWPVASVGANDTRYFCLGDFVEIDSDEVDDYVDVVVGTEYSGTWRTLVGKGDGSFYNEAPLNGPYAGLDIYSMSGTTANEVNGLVCGDFDGDDRDDFILLSGSAKTMQVHLGNGAGRFNQNEDSPFLNAANEGIGFAMDRFARRPKAADFNGDGKLDLMVDFGTGTFSVVTNMTSEERGFDLDATRLLLTPLGKTPQATGGDLINMAVGDVTGDGVPDVVGITSNGSISQAQWIKTFHPIASQYRDWMGPSKIGRSPTVFVWSSEQGTYGEFEPSYPAAYDRFPTAQFSNSELHGATNALDMQLVDIANPSGGVVSPSGDTYLDIVVSGSSAGGNPVSEISVYTNLAQNLWDTSLLTQSSYGSFAPLNGGEKAFTAPASFTFFTPPGYDTPGIFVASNAGGQAPYCSQFSPMMRFCPWNQYAKDDKDPPTSKPYWDCWEPVSCDAALGTKFGGAASRILKLSVAEGSGGAADNDPMTPGHLLVASQGGENLTLYPYNDTLEYPGSIPLAWPVNENLYWFFDEPINLAVGLNPTDIAVEDVDGDGLADIVTAIQKNVMISFGDTENPFESFQPVDKRPGYEQKGGVAKVVLSDVNADSFKDIVFTESSSSSITVYLATGLDTELEYRRQYHGPITIPVCAQPTGLKAVDFDGDGCDTLVALCEGAGAVALMQNDTCAKQAE